MASRVVLNAGQVFARRYRVERLIKAGGMGAVYEVRHTQNNKRWALKIMHADIGRDPDAQQRFVREAQIDGVIESTHVVSVIDAGVDEDTGTPFLVMEFLVGEELGEVMERVHRLPAQQVVSILAQVSRALDKAHAKGIVHRDLKPENLFLARNEEEGEKVKILDFGIAKILSGANQSSTQAGGTPLYMAPEQTRKGRDIGPWTDVWALGLIAYALLVGRPYWEVQTIGELYGELLDPSHRERPTLRAARAGVALPPAFDDWFFRCVNNETQQRFRGAGEAILQLAHALGVASNQPASLVAPIAGTQPMAPGTLMMTPTPSAAIRSGQFGTLHVGQLRNQPAAMAATAPQIVAQGGVQTTATPVSEGAEPLPLERTKPPNRTPLFVAGGVVAAVVVGGGIYAASSGGRKDNASTAASTANATAASANAPAPSASASSRFSGSELRDTLAKDNPFVRVGSLEVMRTEVTRGQFAQWLEAQASAKRPKLRPLRDWTGEPPDEATIRRPVTWVTLSQATKFCAAIDARLPTSDEWTALAGGKASYPWGSAWPPPKPSDVAIGRGAKAHAVDVGTSPGDASKEGVVDLFGNVSEWTSTAKDGLATVRGGQIDESLNDAKDMFENGVQKAAEEGASPGDRAEEVADGLTGFRCVKGA